ncbi:pepsin-like aspartic protease [Thalassotalea montiporae]
MKSITLELTNVYAKGDFTATVYLGSEQSTVNLIIDTGSSTLVVEPNNYQPAQDKNLVATPIVQEVNYGLGGWAGAVVHSQLCFTSSEAKASKAKTTTNTHSNLGNQKTNKALVCNTSIAVVEAEPTKTFGDADGILGLAYHHLNKSFDLTEFYNEKQISPALSLPWPFSIGDKTLATQLADIKTSSKQLLIDNSTQFKSLKAFKAFLWQQPEHDIKPFFTQIADQHLVDNRFSFYAKRSSVHVASENISAVSPTTKQIEELVADPLNQGRLILGGSEAQTDLYRGTFKTIKVFHDVYYNVKLHSVQVGNNTPILAEPLAPKDEKSYFTNAIIDTGASLTILPQGLFQQVTEQLSEMNPKFAKLLAPFAEINQQYLGVDANQLELTQWPDLTFRFIGEDEKDSELVALVCPPSHYWQINTPEKDKACFKLLSQLPNWPNQSIIGLPLITNYYTVFDRSVNGTGVIRFAQQS